jgi:hypothetical protein
MPTGFDASVVRNVSQPTLTAFLPDSSVATGTAVIVCPGGGFHFLSMASEGLQAKRSTIRDLHELKRCENIFCDKRV